MTTNSSFASFNSTSSGAMDIDDTPPSSYPISQDPESKDLVLESFHDFSRLDPSIQTRIWQLACPPPRTRFLELYNCDSAQPKIRYIPSLPALFHVTHDSRGVIVANEGGEIIHFTGDLQGTGCYFNPTTDILFLSNRFTTTYNALETYRIRELIAILPSSVTSRLRRLLVTYSGLDSYEQIGPLLRPLASLEVLYIGMKDSWTSGMVRRLLHKGRPAPGVVAGKISRIVKEVEAEETDDEDELEEEVERRMAVRKKRRIVEADVRLDE